MVAGFPRVKIGFRAKKFRRKQQSFLELIWVSPNVTFFLFYWPNKSLRLAPIQEEENDLIHVPWKNSKEIV